LLATSERRTWFVRTGLRPEGSIISCRGQASNPEWAPVALATFRLITDIGLVQWSGARLKETSAVTLSASDKLAEPPEKMVEMDDGHLPYRTSLLGKRGAASP